MRRSTYPPRQQQRQALRAFLKSRHAPLKTSCQSQVKNAILLVVFYIGESLIFLRSSSNAPPDSGLPMHDIFDLLRKFKILVGDSFCGIVLQPDLDPGPPLRACSLASFARRSASSRDGANEIPSAPMNSAQSRGRRLHQVCKNIVPWRFAHSLDISFGGYASQGPRLARPGAALAGIPRCPGIRGSSRIPGKGAGRHGGHRGSRAG